MPPPVNSGSPITRAAISSGALKTDWSAGTSAPIARVRGAIRSRKAAYPGARSSGEGQLSTPNLSLPQPPGSADRYPLHQCLDDSAVLDRLLIERPLQLPHTPFGCIGAIIGAVGALTLRDELRLQIAELLTHRLDERLRDLAHGGQKRFRPSVVVSIRPSLFRLSTLGQRRSFCRSRLGFIECRPTVQAVSISSQQAIDRNEYPCLTTDCVR